MATRAARSTVAAIRTPPAWAMASMISTPGMIGRPGQCPWKNGSLMLTFLIATSDGPGADLEHPVDQQEGVAVRQDLDDPLDVDRAVLPERDGRRLRAVRLVLLQALEQPAHQGGVGVVARPVGDDEAVQVHAQQRQVADHVQDLVPGALVGEAERVADDAVAAEDQDVGLGGPDADPRGPQGLGLGLQQEGPAGRELAAERSGA